MSLIDENPPNAPLGGDPLTSAPVPSPTYVAPPKLPEDLRISWSWPHLLLFISFIVISQFVVGIFVVGYYSLNRHLSQAQLRKLLESDPKILVGVNVLLFALVFLFLYVTLAVLRDSPFWRSLGWKKLTPDPHSGKTKSWVYFVSGAGLAIFVAIASSHVKNAEHTPIEEFLKNRAGALSLMAMAVFVAPLVEETVFRGYLYPVFVRILSGIARFFGMEYAAALHAGVVTSVFLTGTLFGLMHGYQLGWTWGLVALLILVGVIFTFARAWTGTVLASFLLHLGYNSMIALSSIIATKGFTHLPPVR